ncbi:MAG: hypothetical protein MUO72_09380 [Bacteroidales bacterium]|nr:hypothetical protein [Bacteroidales bacterium]
MEPCIKESELEKMGSDIYSKNGIISTISRIEEKINNLVIASAAQTSVITNLLAFQTEFNSVERYKERQGFSARQKAGIYVTAIIGVSAVAVSLIVNLI